jgi:hypothetical protein
LLKKQAERMKTKNLAAADASKSFFAVAACRRLHPFSKTTPFADISVGVDGHFDACSRRSRCASTPG